MLNKKLEKALNEQINFELYSAYIYYSMSAHFQTENLPGFGNWMHVQAMEEMVHVEKFYNFILDRGGVIKLDAIAAPAQTWVSPRAAFEAALEHERLVTGRINKLVDLAIAESDHATNTFLQWFVTEQVEEEKNASDITGQLKHAEGAPAMILMLDRELAARVFTMPAGGTGAGSAAG